MIRLSKVALALASGLSVAQMARAAPPAASDLANPAPSVMTGTVGERNAAINAVLVQPGGITQMNITDIDAGTLVLFLRAQLKIDITLDWPALEKSGVARDVKVSLNLYNVAPPQVLTALCWVLRAPSGNVGYTIADGALHIGPQEKAPPPHDDPTDRQNAATKATLQQPLADNFLPADGVPLKTALHVLSMQKKLNIVLDWSALEKAGAAPDALLKVDTKGKTVEAVLGALFDQITLKGGELPAFKIDTGMVHVSTRAALGIDAERKHDPVNDRGASGGR